MLLLAAVIYLLLAMRVRIGLSVSLCGERGSFVLAANAAGICLRYDGEVQFGKKGFLTKPRYGALPKRKKGKNGKTSRMVRHFFWLKKTGKTDLISFRARIGLDDAGETAFTAGCVNVVASALFSVLGSGEKREVCILPDFDSVGFCAHLRCIFSCQLGDIILAAIKTVVRKNRREGLDWKSIPLRA